MRHAPSRLELVTVDSYGTPERDVNKRTFLGILEDARRLLGDAHLAAFGRRRLAALTVGELERILSSGAPKEAAVILSAIDGLARQLASTLARLLRRPPWRGTQRVFVGGGLREGRLGELIVARTEVLLRPSHRRLELVPLRNDPDEGGLLGAVHLVPWRALRPHAALLAVDLGGTNLRVGVVGLRLRRGVPEGRVAHLDLWRHAAHAKDLGRDQLVHRLCEMLRAAARWARRHGLALAPIVGVACPGAIAPDGHILHGSHNLPGNWTASSFNLARRISEEVPELDGADTVVILHNDAVVQGLSQLPFARDVRHWAVLTIGTGLGKARFTNRRRPHRPGGAPGRPGPSRRAARTPR
jgi:hypothetical protein